MHLAAPSRRALGLAAVGAIAASTSVLGVGGVAQAAPPPSPLPMLAFSTDPDRVADDYQLIEGSFEVPTGYCSIDWFVLGGAGGAGTGGAGAAGGIVAGLTDAVPGTYTPVLGDAGADGLGTTPGAGGAGDPAGAAGATGMTMAPTGPGGALVPVPSGAGGGGGGGTSVAGPGGGFIRAAGGAGGMADAGMGSGAGGGVNGFDMAGDEGLSAGVSDYDGWSGVVEAVLTPCEEEVVEPAPPAPDDVTAEDRDGEALVRFTETWGDGEATGDPASYEVSVDGGAFEPVATAWDEAWQRESFLLSGVTTVVNGQEYEIAVRALNADGVPGPAGEVVTARPFVPASPPTGVSVDPGVASVRVDWDPVATPGTYGVDHYDVDLIYSGGEFGGRENVCSTTDVFSCLIGLDTQVGFTYSVVVTTVDAWGHYGADSVVVPVGAPAAPSVPATVPASDGSISRTDGGSGVVGAGSTVTLSGDGYLPGSTVTLIVYSTPQVLGHTTADVDGHWEVSVVIPAGLVSGAHTLVASGVDAAGNPRFVTLPITVTGGAAGGGTGAGGGLAYTGADVAVPAIGGLAALAVGGGLVLAGRRRRTAE
ncbi:hypothetical protein [Blastococcus sp. SYSU D00813]